MKVLLVDDDVDFLSMLTTTAPPWLEMATCASSAAATRILESRTGRDAQVAILDLCMPPYLHELAEREGIALAKWISQHRSNILMILVSQSARRRPEAADMPPGVLGFIAKPLHLDPLYRFLASFSRLFPQVSTTTVHSNSECQEM